MWYLGPSETMRIAFIVDTFPTLTETFIINQVAGLLEAGHDVQVFAAHADVAFQGHPAVERYRLMERVHSWECRLAKLPRVCRIARLLPVSFLRGPLRVIDSLNVFNQGATARSPGWFHYLRAFRGRTFDVIHCHFGWNGVLGCMLKQMGVSGKLVTTFYGRDISASPRQEKWRRAYQILFRDGDLFLVEGSHMRQCLVNLGCPMEKVRIQHIMVDINNLPFIRRGPKGATDEVVLLHCGRFVEKKGLIYAIQALEMLLPRYPRLTLRVIGDGPLMPTIREYVHARDLDGHVTFLGYQAHDIFVQECLRADIMLQPSVTAADGDSEGGAPTVLIEAQATGLPVVATYHADIPEVVVDGRSGLLAGERDVDDLAQKVEQLVRRPELCADMGCFGRRHVSTNHAVSSEVSRLEACYRLTTDATEGM